MKNRKCYIVVGSPDNLKLAIVKEGERGYFLTEYQPIKGDWDYNIIYEIAATYNDRMNLSSAEVNALVAGSMFGFDIPACSILNQ